ncbi:DNA-binding response regulator, LuxR family, partial [Pseudomonas syringae pv. maculicola]
SAAVRGALRGEVFVADSVRRVLREAQQYGPDALLAAERLSPRELEVLRL